MECLKMEKTSYSICRLPHNTTNINLERKTFFFSLEFVTTSYNNHNLASFCKIFTKCLRTISFKKTSPLTITNLSWSRSKTKTRGWRWKKFCLQEILSFPKWEIVDFSKLQWLWNCFMKRRWQNEFTCAGDYA